MGKNKERYFIVFYEGIDNNNDQWKKGTVALKAVGKNPFLNLTETIKFLNCENGDNYDFIVTGFNEVNKKDFKTWSKVD